MLKIWGRPNSIHTQRVLWTCVEANVTYELIPASATMGPDGHISGGGAPYGVVDTPQYLAMNPNGTVPTIDDARSFYFGNRCYVATIWIRLYRALGITDRRGYRIAVIWKSLAQHNAIDGTWHR